MTFIASKRIAITGAGGSIGSELAARLIELDAKALLLIDNSEVGLWRLAGKHEGASIDCRLGDVRDYHRMRELFSEFRPQIVFHAAALKHVPFCERDYSEADKTNRHGTAHVGIEAGDAGAELVILISTDKATDPVCELGRTKASAEVIMSRLNMASKTCRFASIRFHNVIGSSGSVVGRFAEQIARGGPITITHSDMVRWFATPREACDLLIRCAEHAVSSAGLDLYALNIGKPMKIVDLAKAMIGERNVEICFIGLRPGERLNEKLVGEKEKAIYIGIDGIIGIEQISDESVRAASGVASGEASATERQISEPEAARA